ncbi:MBOAT family O-acyltransferase [Devosia ginsengisoli]|uniref:Probable alginate O-acetylase AlgI n=1 Tax=Devosia ginsengisoli TaxID=400770 RepID=A0A5B8LRK4_9HYPH|nr:MBOAT family O-acyltransferase [Devosia ginsengisoli]QDZ10509.1 MBOAT family protein [Devosia ginsengisoli]
MLFNSYEFVFLFLPVTLAAFLISNAVRPSVNGWVLLLASLVFYAYWDLPFVLLLVASLVVNYAVGWRVRESRTVFWLGIALNLALLFWFKYALFTAGIFVGKEGARTILGDIILPLGISFWTFHQISYLVDIRRGSAPRPSLPTYATYVLLFPQLIAGPIVRYKHISWKLQRLFMGLPLRRLVILMSSGLALFALGLFKKAAIADPLSFWADPVFAAASAGTRPLSTLDAWIGAFAYSFQLYFDFSAYSDMALGLARMVGIIFPMNFFSPYKSRSIDEFWRRWHMSLSYFVRDYIYIPLGGSRSGPSRQMLNLFIAFVLIGIWHGAGFAFLLWGAYHGALVGLSHIVRRIGVPRMPAVVGVAVTFLLVVFGWVLFRAEDMTTALNVYGPMFTYSDRISIFNEFAQLQVGILLIALAAGIAFFAPNTSELLASRSHGLIYGLRWPASRRFAAPWFRRYALPALVGVALYFGLTSMGGLGASFLYFNF